MLYDPYIAFVQRRRSLRQRDILLRGVCWVLTLSYLTYAIYHLV